ncbi:hypothetical protein BCF11_2527 [Collimonas sp. PA-H2]|uniref:hypothetical protein n=1 Tax=Collimonas sp. PA-H2 TaxID=1881062 RepID=UPI000C01BB44|nr:hypothetical protein [Collimonas sp. PA-H2]PFH10117.1 hypothetical protein BCF11_2527 [Collimonas sp. PA-H2]
MKAITKIALGMALSSLLGACTTLREQPLVSSEMNTISGKTVAVSRYATPDFSAITPTKAAFGMFGAIAMINAGNSFVKDNSIADPAENIGRQLADALGNKYQTKTVVATDGTLSDDDIGAIVKQYGASDLVMDVKTINWSYMYYPVNWDSYRILYTARMRLIDTRRKTVIAEGFCKRMPEKDEQKQSFDAMVADQGAWVKEVLQGYAKDCSNELKKKALLMLPATPVAQAQ